MVDDRRVMAEGFSRMRGQGDSVASSSPSIPLWPRLECKSILHKVGGEFLLSIFNNLPKKNEK